MPEQIAVVITHYKSPEKLEECLTALAASDAAHRLDIVVADSEAQDGARELVERVSPAARYLPFARNVGYAKLVNAGIHATSAPYVLILNADIVVGQDSVDVLARFLDANPEVAVAGPQMAYQGGGGPQDTAFAFYRPATILYRRTPLRRTARGQAELARFTMRAEVAQSRRTGRALDADWLMGAAMMVRRTAIREVGDMDEVYFLYFEDVDWCLRFWRAGWRVVYVPTTICRHGWARASNKGGLLAILTNPLARRHVRSAVRFFRLNGIRPKRASSTSKGRTRDTAAVSGESPTR